MSEKLLAKNVLPSGTTLGEGPLWDPQDNVLWWVDIEQGLLNCFDPSQETNQKYELGQRVGAVVQREKGGLLLALANGFATFDPRSESLALLCDPEADLPNNRFNDGKCDPEGRFWAGTMNVDSLNLSSGALYSLDPQLRVRKHLSGVNVSNGIAWSSDAKTMYYIDSLSGSIEAFDYDRQSGDLSRRRPVFKVPEELGCSDGMTIDAEDKLWVAFWGGWCVSQIDPANGQQIAKVELPVAHVTSCAFGGADLRDLYITTADMASTRRRCPSSRKLAICSWLALRLQELPRSSFVDEFCQVSGQVTLP